MLSIQRLLSGVYLVEYKGTTWLVSGKVSEPRSSSEVIEDWLLGVHGFVWTPLDLNKNCEVDNYV